jgi:predicted DNA-binding transcriptional regulator AlpA
MRKTPSPIDPLPARFLSPTELADLLGVPVQTLYQWRYLGTGPRGFKAGRHLRYDPAEVRRWITERTLEDDRAA